MLERGGQDPEQELRGCLSLRRIKDTTKDEDARGVGVGMEGRKERNTEVGMWGGREGRTEEAGAIRLGCRNADPKPPLMHTTTTKNTRSNSRVTRKTTHPLETNFRAEFTTKNMGGTHKIEITGFGETSRFSIRGIAWHLQPPPCRNTTFEIRPMARGGEGVLMSCMAVVE